MRPSEVLAHVERDHETIRAMLATLEQVATRVRRGEAQLVGPLRLEAETLLSTLRDHMYWEDRYLRPALLQADAWGQERAKRLDDDHAEQRQVLEDAVQSVLDPERSGLVLARSLLELVVMLRADMKDEESWLANDSVLRDDVVAIDVEGG